MDELNGPVGALVRHLDGLGPDPALTDLVRVLEAAALTTADVAPFIKETPGGYHRALIARRDHYELLILTWLPGQGSAPHDHSGSVSAMQVLQGEALEGCWRIAPEGYVGQEFETPVRPGEMTAWQDAGIHTVRNSAANETTLITVHIYAPPLKDFRRFVVQPNSESEAPPIRPTEVPTVVVVGGGFSGSVTAAQLLRRGSDYPSGLRVVLVERQGAIGEGLAYSTRQPCHLLNVPAGA